jgi:hypothetical protein
MRCPQEKFRDSCSWCQEYICKWCTKLVHTVPQLDYRLNHSVNQQHKHVFLRVGVLGQYLGLKVKTHLFQVLHTWLRKLSQAESLLILIGMMNSKMGWAKYYPDWGFLGCPQSLSKWWDTTSKQVFIASCYTQFSALYSNHSGNRCHLCAPLRMLLHGL